MRHPKIYVVTEEPFHENSTIALVTLDIDEAFSFVEQFGRKVAEMGGEAWRIPPLHPQTPEGAGYQYRHGADWMYVHEFEGGQRVGEWHYCIDKDNEHGRFGNWLMREGNTFKFFPRAPSSKTRSERLIEAAEVIMTMAVGERSA